MIDECHRCKANEVPSGCLPMKYYETTGTLDSGEEIVLRYDVSSAFAWAKENVVPVQLPFEMACNLIITNLSETFCGAHVEHVNRRIHPICGTYEQKLLLLDGTHRLFARLKYHERPLVYLLNEEQTAMFRLP